MPFEQFMRLSARMKQKGVFEFGFSDPPITVSSEQLSGVPIAVSWPDGSGYIVQQAQPLENTDGLFTLPSNYLEAQIPLLGM